MTNQIRKAKCLRCKYEWTPRVEGRPRQCPRCHQARWDIPAGTVRQGRPPKLTEEQRLKRWQSAQKAAQTKREKKATKQSSRSVREPKRT